MSSDSRQLAAICAIARNEGPYLAEWAVYHRMIGFDDILVYNNESTDETADVLKALQDQNVVRTLDWASTPDGRTQKRAYADGLSRLRPEFQWVAFIDLDEFLYVPGFGNDIQSFLAAHDDRDAIAVNWKLFGTSGRQTRTDGLVTERFTQRADTQHSGNRAVKTLARTDALITPNLHNHDFAQGVVYATVTGEVIPPATGKSETVSHDIICLHHYFTKSREEWDLKVARGRATKPDNHPEKLRREEHFRMHNRNDEVDVSLVQYAPAIKARLAELVLPAAVTPAPLPLAAAPAPLPAATSAAAVVVPSRRSAPGGKTSYSQFAEDLIAETILLRQGVTMEPGGTYLDVGACWPVKYSNTFFYYERGWRGLCIDPQPGFEVEFLDKRPEDICVNVGIADAPGEMDYFAFENPVFNTFDRVRATKLNAIGKGGRTLLSETRVPVRPLQAVIAETIGVDRRIDLVSLDVEGFEQSVLSSLDWEVTRPLLFIIELKSKAVTQSMASDTVRFMRDKGYEAVTVTNQNLFFLNGRK
ncbi:hypothetical protein ASG17_11540 [Brevundimonas sp. Leaf363]|uniref:glycosyltransferase family 2 protein n=1 Tax=Brevundimonas sp. Leaf363 TaxID=1736353 RepID=UPI0006FBCEE3|nr:glycosyltransferase family 2 protein [Brevundimonas sp. Leaf363]KQS54275.1 hypothetical protein ASG17_11540 [Brevundimonas sp. Leaf363]